METPKSPDKHTAESGSICHDSRYRFGGGLGIAAISVVWSASYGSHFRKPKPGPRMSSVEVARLPVSVQDLTELCAILKNGVLDVYNHSLYQIERPLSPPLLSPPAPRSFLHPCLIPRKNLGLIIHMLQKSRFRCIKSRRPRSSALSSAQCSTV